MENRKRSQSADLTAIIINETFHRNYTTLIMPHLNTFPRKFHWQMV